MITLLSPAKVNLFLHITGKLKNGYHTLYSLMCPIALYDEISISMGVDENTITCSHPLVPEDESNIALKAAHLFFKTLNGKDKSAPSFVSIHLEKKIPVGAGLGGGSSNAAGILLSLNRYYNHPFSLEKLMSMGVSLGADVPFFMLESPAIARGIGEKLKKVTDLPKLSILVVYPNIHVPTPMIYKNLNLGLTKGEKKLNYSIFSSNNFDLIKNLYNDLESVTLVHYPIVTEIKKLLIQNGANGALMSGSGSSVFGLFEDTKSAKTAYDLLSQNNDWQIFLSHMLV